MRRKSWKGVHKMASRNVSNAFTVPGEVYSCTKGTILKVMKFKWLYCFVFLKNKVISGIFLIYNMYTLYVCSNKCILRWYNDIQTCTTCLHIIVSNRTLAVDVYMRWIFEFVDWCILYTTKLSVQWMDTQRDIISLYAVCVAQWMASWQKLWKL